MSRRLAGFLAGAGAARTGDELSGPALLLVGLAVTGSATVGPALVAGLTASAAIGGPVLGALLDRSRQPGRLLAGALAAYAAGLTAILAALGHWPTALVVGLAVLIGVLNPALAGGWSGQLPRLVPADGLARASALDALTFNVAALAGPGLAGLVAAVFGARAAVGVAIGLVLLALPLAWSLPARTRPAKRERLAAELRAGFATIVRSRTLLRATATSMVSFTGLGMLTVSYPLLGAARLGNPTLGAVLLTVVAVAAMLANAVLAALRPKIAPDTLVLLSVLAFVASLVVAAVAWWPPLLIGAAVLAGLGQGPQLTALFAIRHRESEERLRAQVFTTGGSLKITGFAAGAALAGPIAAHSLTWCLLAGAATQLLAAATYLAIGALRTRAPARAV